MPTPKPTKNYMIRVRVTEEEHDRFTKQATEKGYKSVSEYIRSLVTDAPKAQRT